MRFAALLIALQLAFASAAAANDTPATDCVVLLHGLARSDRSMRSLERRISSSGFRVHNVAYPSKDGDPDHLLRYLQRNIDTCSSEPPAKVHFVTHSLGGILLRAYLRDARPENLGRVVMLAPPNHGSELVDALAWSWILRTYFGPTFLQLGTDPTSLPNRLGPADFDVGIIAGTRTHNPIGSLLIPGDDDGTVSVRSAKLDGMSDFLEHPRSHTFILSDRVVAEQVVHFIESGRFRH